MEDLSTAAAEARIARIRSAVWARHPEWGEMRITEDLDALAKDAATPFERVAWQQAEAKMALAKDYHARIHGPS